MEETKSELRPCPFCDEETGVIMRHAANRVTANGDDGKWWVTCHRCGTDGPYCDSRSDAQDKWNTRVDDALKAQRDELLALIERVNVKCHHAVTVDQALADLHDIERMTDPAKIGGAS